MHFNSMLCPCCENCLVKKKPTIIKSKSIFNLTLLVLEKQNKVIENLQKQLTI